jgi:hypothetical protein
LERTADEGRAIREANAVVGRQAEAVRAGRGAATDLPRRR